MPPEQALPSTVSLSAQSGPATSLIDGWVRFNQFVMSTSPLVPAAIGLIIGICLGEYVRPEIGWMGLLMAAFSLPAIVPAARSRLAILIVAGSCAGLGGLLHWNAVVAVPHDSVVRLLDSDVVVRIRGTLISEPTMVSDSHSMAAWRRHQESTSFLLRVDAMESESGWTSASGTLRAGVNEAVLDLNEGDAVEAFGRLEKMQPSQNPGAFDWRAYLRLQGIDARLICDQRENIVRHDRGGPSLSGWLRTRARAMLTEDLSAAAIEESSLLEAMVLGHRSRFDRRLNDIFTRAGCVHFIAASGSNIVVLMAALWLVGRMMGLEKRRCAWLMIVAVVLYGLVAEPRPPILRACVMGLLFCVALFLQRAASHLNWMAAAAIALCCVNPVTVFDVGFQLSFAAVFGVAYLAPALLMAGSDFYWWFREVLLGDRFVRADLRLRKIAERFAPLSRVRLAQRNFDRLFQTINVVVAVSLGAWLISIPITAYWFQQIQPWGVISSVLVYPLVALIMVLGIAKVIVASISPLLAAPITWVLSVIDAVLIRVVEWLAELPGASLTLPAPPWWLILAFYFFLLSVVIVFRKQSPRPHYSAPPESAAMPPRVSRNWLVGSLAALSLATLGWSATPNQPPQLIVTILAVGAGSATVLEMPTGETIVYDAGSLTVSGVGRSIVAPFLRTRGIRRVDQLYISHPNLDHFSGVTELMEQIPVERVLWNHCFEQIAPPRSASAELLKAVREAKVGETMPSAPSRWDFGGVWFEMLWPPSGSCEHLSANDSSTVLRLTYGETSILFTGDIEESAQRSLMAGSDLDADVLILPHHGSVCASTREFVESVGAGTAIRSSGQPTEETINGLPELLDGKVMLNTADAGAIRIVMDPDSVTVEPWLTPARP